MTEHALILCREPGRHSTLDKGHEEGVDFRTVLGLLDPLCFHTDFRSSLSGPIKIKESKQLLIHVLIAITDFTIFTVTHSHALISFLTQLGFHV